MHAKLCGWFGGQTEYGEGVKVVRQEKEGGERGEPEMLMAEAEEELEAMLRCSLALCMADDSRVAMLVLGFDRAFTAVLKHLVGCDCVQGKVGARDERVSMNGVMVSALGLGEACLKVLQPHSCDSSNPARDHSAQTQTPAQTDTIVPSMQTREQVAGAANGGLSLPRQMATLVVNAAVDACELQEEDRRPGGGGRRMFSETRAAREEMGVAGASNGDEGLEDTNVFRLSLGRLKRELHLMRNDLEKGSRLSESHAAHQVASETLHLTPDGGVQGSGSLGDSRSAGPQRGKVVFNACDVRTGRRPRQAVYST